MDEVKAKIAYEKSEKEYRAKEAEERRIREMAKKNLEEARKKQFAHKDMLFTQAAKKERELFLKQCDEIKASENAEKDQLEQKRLARLANGSAVVGQMAKNEAKRKANEAAYIEEGRKLREDLENVRQNILDIKEEKLAFLDELKIADKFKVELKNKKVVF